MNARKKFRAIMADNKKCTLMPGAYDALSARIIEAEGFEAVVAGGYAAIGSMLAQADMGQSNMRDYAAHYGRICDAVQIPVYVDADTGFGGVNNVRQMVRAFEAAGVAGLFISDQVFPNRCGYLPGKQIVLDAMEEGLLINCTHDTVLRMLPPYILTEQDVDRGIAVLNKVFKKVKPAA